MKKNQMHPEKVMMIHWNKLSKKYNVSDLIPAWLFKFAYVRGWKAGRSYQRKNARKI